MNILMRRKTCEMCILRNRADRQSKKTAKGKAGDQIRNAGK